MSINLLDKVVGCALAGAAGDALGVPFETMTPQKMRKHWGKVHGYRSIGLGHPFLSMRGRRKGSWSDDTEQSGDIFEALIEAGGKFDMDIIARRFMRSYDSLNRRGWGRASRNSAKRLLRGVRWHESGDINGFGNGVMMKIEALGLLQALHPKNFDAFLDDCVTLAKMTHLGPPAIVGGAVHASAISYLANVAPETSLNFEYFLYELEKVALEIEARRDIMDYPHKISDQLVLIRKLHEIESLYEEDPEKLAMFFGGGTKEAFSAFNSFGLSYAVFVKRQGAFDAVVEVIYSGGDTDTNAKIIGSMVGAYGGLKSIPQKFISGLEDHERIYERAERFYRVCKK